MTFDLLEERWIPIVRRSGARSRIRPADVTSAHATDPIVALDAPRPDFNGALAQFLIGLVQTLAPPRDDDAWTEGFATPPEPARLQTEFKRPAGAFDLEHPAHPFYQDPSISLDETEHISGLLIGSPGVQTRKNNTAFIVKDRPATGVCQPCSATAILALQFNGPEGGRGNLTSLRGGGPLTTLLWGRTLWESVWLNVLDLDRFGAVPGDHGRNLPHDSLLWLRDLPADPKPWPDLTPDDTNPAHVYWSMSRRIRLTPAVVDGTECALCGDDSGRVFRAFRSRPKGLKYEGGWKHPLTPYVKTKDGALASRKGRPEYVGYRHWLGLTMAADARGTIPAEVVARFHGRWRPSDQVIETRPRLWAFGFDMNHDSPQSWHGALMPVLPGPPDVMRRLEGEVSMLVDSADQVARILRDSVKRALVPAAKKNLGVIRNAETSLWSATEPAFYATIDRLHAAVMSSEAPTPHRETWLSRLQAAAMAQFDAVTRGASIADRSIARTARTRVRLCRVLWGPKLRKALDLPVADPSTRTTRGKKTSAT